MSPSLQFPYSTDLSWSRGAYGQDIFTLRSTYFQGRPPKSVNMYWRRFPVSSIPLPKTSNPTSQESEAFSNWLMARWKEKELLLEGYARDGRFPADEEHNMEGEPGAGMIKGAGFIETEVRLAHWYEILHIFSVPSMVWVAVSTVQNIGTSLSTLVRGYKT